MNSNNKPTFNQIINSLNHYFKYVKVVGLTFNNSNKTYTLKNRVFNPIELLEFILNNQDEISIIEKYFLPTKGKFIKYETKIYDHKIQPLFLYKNSLIRCKTN